MSLSATVADISKRVKSKYLQKRDMTVIKTDPHQMRRELRLSGLPEKGLNWRSVLLTDDEHVRLANVFESIDLSGDGRIDPDELRLAFSKEKISLTRNDAVQIIWEAIDGPQLERDGNDVTMTLKELTIAYRRGRQDPQEPRRLFSFILFKILDSANRGSVSIDELHSFFSPKLSPSNLDFYTKRLFPKAGNTTLPTLTAPDFIRLMHSRLWTLQTFRLEEPRKLRPQIVPPERMLDAKLKYLKAMDEDYLMFKTERELDKLRNPDRKFSGFRVKGLDSQSGVFLKDVVGGFVKQIEKQKTQEILGAEYGTAKHGRMLKSLSETFDLRVDTLEMLLTQFRAYDTDGSGALEKQEFKKAVAAVLDDPSVTEKDLERAWTGSNLNEEAQLDTFIMWYIRFRPRS
jgi:Ca2+-binding EF-hand superfamily protein